MTISIELMDENELGARIKVVGVGGSGGNALNTMISSGLEGVPFNSGDNSGDRLPTRIAL